MRGALLFFLVAALSPLWGLDVESEGVFDHPVTTGDATFVSTYQKVAYGGSWVADFAQTKHIGGINRSFRSTGTMYLEPGFGIAWNIQKPYPSLMVVSSSSLTQKLPGKEPIRLEFGDNPVFTHISRTIEMVLSGSLSTLEESFFLSFMKEGEEWVLALKPKQKDVASFVGSFVLGGREELNTVLMYEKSGDSVRYDFSCLKRRPLSEEEHAAFSM